MWTPPYKTKAIAYKSTVTGKVYSMSEYANHGNGGTKTFRVREKDGSWVEVDRLDLPADEYPYEYVYEDPMSHKPKWMD